MIAFDSADSDLYQIQTTASGPSGILPVDEDMLRHAPSGDLFALSQNAGMGWDPGQLRRKGFLILGT